MAILSSVTTKGINRKFVLFSLVLAGFIALLTYTAFYGKVFYYQVVDAYSNNDTLMNTNQFLAEHQVDVGGINRRYYNQTITLTSDSGEYLIPATILLANKELRADTVILIHGIGKSRLATMGIAQLFLEHGYNVVAYDQRASGANLSPYSTYGYLERDDLIAFVKRIRQTIGDQHKLIVWGTNAGAATAMYAGQDVQGEVDGFILDDPIYSMGHLVVDKAMERGENVFTIGIGMMTGDINLRSRHGFGLFDTQMSSWIPLYDIPSLYMAHEHPRSRAYSFAQRLKDVTLSSDTHLEFYEGADDLYLSHREAYGKQVMDFIADLPARIQPDEE